MDEQKHSGLGIASFITGITSGIITLLSFCLSVIVSEGGILEEPANTVVVLFLLGGLSLAGVALGLGIAGLVQRERKKILAVLGTLFAAATFVGMIFVIMLELSTTTPTASVTFATKLLPAEAQPGDTWIRPIDGMVMVYVPAPAAPFTLQSGLAAPTESYWIDKYEVTNAQYQLCVDAGVCEPSGRANDGIFNGANQPVVGVTWFDGAAYAGWVDGALPTEEEWEYAAAGETGTGYPWGDEFDGTRLNFCDANCPTGGTAWNDGYRYTAPVGSYPDGESWVGAADMAGNVWEWTDSWWNASQTVRVLRGGAWGDLQGYARTAARLGRYPYFRHVSLGFRVVVRCPPSP
jgi:hypothetical protein